VSQSIVVFFSVDQYITNKLYSSSIEEMWKYRTNSISMAWRA